MFPLFAIAQEATNEVQPRDLDKAQWTRLTKDVNYGEQIKERKPRNNSAPLDFKISGNAALAMKILIGIILGVVLFFILRNLLGLNTPRNKNVKEVLTVEELAQLEENLHQANLDDFIRRAIAQGDYALAVRLYYLAVLKELSIQNRIHWKREKTNRDYLREVRGASFFDAFSDATLVFERIRYGNVVLNVIDFQLIEPKFRALLQQMQVVENL